MYKVYLDIENRRLLISETDLNFQLLMSSTDREFAKMYCLGFYMVIQHKVLQLSIKLKSLSNTVFIFNFLFPPKTKQRGVYYPLLS